MNNMIQDIYNSIEPTLPKGWFRTVFYAIYFDGSYSMKYYACGKDRKYVDCFSFSNAKTLIGAFKKADAAINPERMNLSEKEKWSVITISMEHDGKVTVSYSYDKVDNQSAFENNWKKEFLK